MHVFNLKQSSVDEDGKTSLKIITKKAKYIPKLGVKWWLGNKRYLTKCNPRNKCDVWCHRSFFETNKIISHLINQKAYELEKWKNELSIYLWQMIYQISNKTPLIMYNWLHQHTTKFERLSMYTGDFKIFMQNGPI